MGFDIENNKSSNNSQLNFFDYQLPKADFEGSSAVDYNSFLMAHSEPEPSQAGRFMTFSATLHAAAILIIAMMSVPLIEQTKTETITIEIEDVTPIKIARGTPVPPTQGGTPTKEETPVVEKLEEAGGPQDIAVPRAAKNVATSKTSSNKAAAKSSAAAIPAGKIVAAKTNFKAVPMTIDDIEAPELDQGELAKATVPSTMSEDFNQDFENINQFQRAAIENEKKSLDDMAAALASEQNEDLNSLDALNEAESARLAAAQNELRKKNSSAIASALAAERAAALAAAREATARQAATTRAGLGGNGSGLGTKGGNGAGSSGSTANGSQLAGIPKGVRSLDQLRQMPGNPRPHYDREERRRGDQGQVAFVAYISKDGYPTQFKMIASTGFRNLDAKTLAALKKWRFYPGQEGWVELPFRWDLKGGLQEDGGLLRRSVGRR